MLVTWHVHSQWESRILVFSAQRPPSVLSCKSLLSLDAEIYQRLYSRLISRARLVQPTIDWDVPNQKSRLTRWLNRLIRIISAKDVNELMASNSVGRRCYLQSYLVSNQSKSFSSPCYIIHSVQSLVLYQDFLWIQYKKENSPVNYYIYEMILMAYKYCNNSCMLLVTCIVSKMYIWKKEVNPTETSFADCVFVVNLCSYLNICMQI